MKIPIIIADQPLPSSIPVVSQEGLAAPYVAGIGLGHSIQSTVNFYSNEMAKTRTMLQNAEDALTINRKVNEFNKFHQETSQILTESPNINQTRRGEIFAQMSAEKMKELMADVSPDNQLLTKKTQLAITQRATVAGLQESQIGFEKKREELDANYDQLAFDAAQKGNINELTRVANEAVGVNVWTHNKRNQTVNKYTEIAKREAERLENKLVETKADLVLTTKYGKNYDKIIDDLENPEEYSKLGLTAERAANLISIVSNRKVKEEKERKAVWDGTRRQFAILDTQDSLSKDHVREALELNSVDPIVAEGYNRRIEEKIKAEGNIKTDPAIYNRLNRLAWEHPDQNYVEKEIMGNVAWLEEADIEKLLGKNQEKSKSIETKARADARERIEKAIFPRVGMTEKFLSTPISEERLSDGLRMLDNGIADAKGKGRPLTSEEIDKLGVDIARKYTTTFQQKMKEFNDYMTKALKPEVKGKKEEFIVGRTYVDKDGRKAKYLGKGEWELQ